MSHTLIRVPDYRVIPSIEQLRQRAAIQALERQHGSEMIVAALRASTDDARALIKGGDGRAPTDTTAAVERIEADTVRRLTAEMTGTLRKVINATGVILHTNLGRAPLTRPALERALQIGAGYSNLEYDVAKGERGSRHLHVEPLLTKLTGAEAALVVNNNAAATLLLLAGLAAGREVLISRGELVEIGGGFRVPDVMAHSGAILREVGTTNRTRVSDYTAVAGDRTALILRVHRSNFRMEGFTAQPSLAELAAAARELRVPLVEDLGSGCCVTDLEWEPSVQASTHAGADLVCFSGDKMLGGPQAGVIVGRKRLIDRLRTHPLLRALRVDKLTLAVLEGTLIEYRSGRAAETVPVLRMIHMPAGVIDQRARSLSRRLDQAGWRTSIVPGASTIGGGSAPGVELPTMLLAIAREHLGEDALHARLRTLPVPVIARIESERVLLDLRTVDPDEDEALVDQLLTIRPV